MYSALIAVILLGVFHGVNPGMGWLFAVFMGKFKGERHVAGTIFVIAAGHIMSVAPIVLFFVMIDPYSIFIKASTPPLIIGCLLLTFGTFTLLRSHKHPRMGLKVGYYQLFFWGLLLGVSHGSGLSLIPFLFGSVDLFLLMAAHFVAVVATMALMAMLTLYVFDLNILRKIWVNFDFMWGVVLLIVGSGVIAEYFF